MRASTQHASLKATVDATLQSLSRSRFRGLTFPAALEEKFEEDTRRKRSRRMWFEGLVAIAGFNICLMLDYLLLSDRSWLSVVRHILLVTPISLAVNALVRRNPPLWLREGGIAFGMFAISIINLIAEGRDSAAATLFGVICVLISALFAGVVMRLRFPYALASLSAMLTAGIWWMGHASALRRPEAMMGDSMLAIGIAIILVASLSLEFEERSVYLLSLQRNLQAEDLAWANQALRELSNLDNLTRLPNRHALDERVALVWKACAEREEPVSAIVVDIDHFKLVNDTYGHLFGDEILRLIGTLLPQSLRSAHDMAVRFGGEEFVLLLPATRPDAAMMVAQRVRSLVESAAPPPHPRTGGHIAAPITVSCGVSTILPGGMLRWNDLIAAADEALYLAKGGGRNRVEFARCIEPSPVAQPASDYIAESPSRGRRGSSVGRLIARASGRRRHADSSAAIQT